MANTNEQRIIVALESGDKTVSELIHICVIERSNLSRYIKNLVKKKKITRFKDNKKVKKWSLIK